MYDIMLNKTYPTGPYSYVGPTHESTNPCVGANRHIFIKLWYAIRYLVGHILETVRQKAIIF